MSMTDEATVLKTEKLADLFVELQQVVRVAARDGQAIHEVERELWQRLLRLGHEALGLFLRLQGDGDLGETVTLPSGETCQRLEGTHRARYLSIFGEFPVQRVVYGSREKQKIDFVPLDNRLQLPESIFSYVLQDWDQSLCVEQAFGQARSTVARILGLKQSVDSLEHMNQEMAKDATTFMLNRPQPPLLQLIDGAVTRQALEKLVVAWALLNLGAVVLLAYRTGPFYGRILACTLIGASFIGVAWSCDRLAARWHHDFSQHYDNYFHTKIFTAMATMDPATTEICVCDYRYYPFFGSRRQFRVSRPLWIPTYPRLATHLRKHQATLVAARLGDFSSQRRYEDVSNWLGADAEAFPVISKDSNYLLVAVQQALLPSQPDAQEGIVLSIRP